jgi:hypothetical protein
MCVFQALRNKTCEGVECSCNCLTDALCLQPIEAALHAHGCVCDCTGPISGVALPPSRIEHVQSHRWHR